MYPNKTPRNHPSNLHMHRPPPIERQTPPTELETMLPIVETLAELQLDLIEEHQTANEVTNGVARQSHSNRQHLPKARSQVSHGEASCQACAGSGVFAMRPAQAEDEQRVVIERFSANTPYERLLVFCHCSAGQQRAKGWIGLPDDAQGISLTTLFALPQQDQAYTAIEKFIARPRGWVSLAGGYGTGKTTLLYAALNDLAALGVYGRYLTAPELLDHLREAISSDCQDSTAARLSRIAALPVLAIDELDKFHATGWAAEQLQKLFDARYRNRRVVGTLIGYNLDGVEHIPPFLRSRMNDGRFQQVTMNGADIRPALSAETELDIEEEVWRRNP